MHVFPVNKKEMSHYNHLLAGDLAHGPGGGRVASHSDPGTHALPLLPRKVKLNRIIRCGGISMTDLFPLYLTFSCIGLSETSDLKHERI